MKTITMCLVAISLVTTVFAGAPILIDNFDADHMYYDGTNVNVAGTQWDGVFKPEFLSSLTANSVSGGMLTVNHNATGSAVDGNPVDNYPKLYKAVTGNFDAIMHVAHCTATNGRQWVTTYMMCGDHTGNYMGCGPFAAANGMFAERALTNVRNDDVWCGPIVDWCRMVRIGETYSFYSRPDEVSPWTNYWTGSNPNIGSVAFVGPIVATHGSNPGNYYYDSFEIYKLDAAWVDITNVTDLIVGNVPTYTVAGTNNAITVGGIVWTNSANGHNGAFPASSTGWTFVVNLDEGTNAISVYGTNIEGAVQTDMAWIRKFTVPPVVTNEAPYSVRVSTARARGNLIVSNLAPTTVILYHGTTDGGTTPGSWQHAQSLGLTLNGRLDVILTNITGTYYYRYYATNIAGETWAPSTESFTPSETPYDGKANGYLRAINIAFSGYSGAKMLGDYPALVNLNETAIPGFMYSQFLSSGNDMRFVAADGSLLSHEIESWDPTGDSLIWVRVPVLLSNTMIQMCYGKAGDTALTDSTNTWDDGFAGVWHMATNYPANATGNTAFDASFVQNPANVTNIAGAAGIGQDFTQNSLVRVGDVDLPTTFTLSCWSYRRGEGLTGNQWNMMKNNSYGLWNQYGNWHLFINQWNWPGCFYDCGFPSTDTTWIYVAGTYNGYDLGIYNNGLLADTSQAVGMQQNDNPLELGINFNGILDEFRAESVTRPSDWILATYVNVNDAYTFASYALSNLAGALAFVDITNYTGTVDFPGSTTSSQIVGTNNPYTVGAVIWSNLLNGTGGSVPASASGWSFAVNVVPGANVIMVAGTNTAGISAEDTVTLRIPSVKVTTAQATGIESFSAMLNGTVNPYDVQTRTWFEYGTDTNYGTFTASSPAGNGNAYIGCSNAVGGLTPETVYHFRAMASNTMGVVVAGADLSLKTAPLIETLYATGIQRNSAVLNGRVNPNGAATQAWLEWGTSTNYGATTPTVNVGSGSVYVPFSAGIEGLTPDEVYHFRAVASDGVTTLYGQDMAFIAGRNITQRGLFFCVLPASVPDVDGVPTGPWEQALPADGTMFPAIDTPTVSISNGVKSVRNYREPTTTGYQARDLTANAQIPCDGVTIIANVQPINCTPGGEERGEIVDIFYDRLALAVAHTDSRLIVCRNNTWGTYGPSLPQDTFTIVSLVVQADGSYICYTNGAAAMTGAANGAFTNMVPVSIEGFKRYVNIGRNNPNGWSSYNGMLGEIFVYTNALTDAEREAVEKLVDQSSQIDITNVSGMASVAGSYANMYFPIVGTNSPYIIGDITWSNSMGGGGVVPANSTTGWTFQALLTVGTNVITATGTNATGSVSDDTVTLIVPSVKVATASATDVASFTAMLNGTVNPYDVQTRTWFEYGTDTNYGTTTPSVSAGNGNASIGCSNALIGLIPETVYHFRAMASNAIGAVATGNDMSFKTTPLLETLYATNIQATSAVLNGRVNPNGAASSAWFEWGTSTNYGTTTPSTNVGSGSVHVPFSTTIEGLTENVTYHFRAVADDGGTTRYGQDMAFVAGRNFTQRGLYFCTFASSIPDGDGVPTGPWKQALPDDGTMFAQIGGATTTVSLVNGTKWVRNYDGDHGGTGFRARDLSADPSIPCDGVTIVANVQPIYYTNSPGVRGEVVDIMYDRLALAVSVGDGRIMVARNYWVDFGPVVPEGMPMVLSLVVQRNGSYTCYTNGTPAMSRGANGYFTNMVPTGVEAFKRFVNIGRNDPDGWSAYNGLLGDIYVYTNALTDAERQEVENVQPAAVSPVDITNVSGTVTLNESYTNVMFQIVGTNAPSIVGDIWWTNSLDGGGIVPANSDTGWMFSTRLAPGTNVVTVSGTNVAGVVFTDQVTLDVVPEPAAFLLLGILAALRMRKA